MYRSSSTISYAVKHLRRANRMKKGWPRYNIKAKLQKTANLTMRWIRYILRTNIRHIEGLQDMIDQELKPP